MNKLIIDLQGYDELKKMVLAMSVLELPCMRGVEWIIYQVLIGHSDFRYTNMERDYGH